MADFQLPDFTTMPEEEVNAYYRGASDEISRRHEVRRIPAQITELATHGRQIGVEEQVMVEAVTKHPGPEPETAPE